MGAYLRFLGDIKAGETPVPVSVYRPDDWETKRDRLPAAHARFAQDQQFAGRIGQRVYLPGDDGSVVHVLYGAGSQTADELGAIALGGLSALLPEGYYVLADMPEDWDPDLCPVGWGLGAYKFDKFLSEPTAFPTLCVENPDLLKESTALVQAIHAGRDLINRPAGDLGPKALHTAVATLAERFNCPVQATVGEHLLTENLPMIHAVGRAAHEAPRLIEFEWGDPDHPRLALLGKGITFDTGGLNIKGASGARLMKKDMGGAAHALALAEMIMANDLPIRLHVLIAIAENAISAGAYRPGDILTSRLGLTVEIDNTDAEGRLVLGDALTKATEDDPVLMIDFATLTGAARVALGPTLPPFFSNRHIAVDAILKQAERHHDPLWPMPLWQPYMRYLGSPIADMKNAGGSFAGAVTAALFLERFVKNRPWMHLDVYGWNPSSLPGHPKGGDMFALRALYHWLKAGGMNTDFSA